MSANASASSAAQQAAQAAANNAAARNLIVKNAVRMSQPIFSQSGINPTNTPTLTIVPRPVGLVLGFYLNIQFTVTNTNTASANASIVPTDFGPANILSNISFNDLENNNRINTYGWHLQMINSVTARRVYGSALVASTGEDSPLGYGSVYNAATSTPGSGVGITSAPSVSYTGTTSQVWSVTFWVPLSYSEHDLRGAIYANIVNATMQLNLTFNTTFQIATAPNPDLLYIGSGNTGTITNVAVNVTQVYYDQLPRGQNGGVILPTIDLSTVYELKSTNYVGMTVNTDFPVQYPNFRDFLSTIAIYYNGAARAPGTDVNNWKLQSASFVDIWKQSPWLCALRTRNHLGLDVPKGCYYFGSRNKPISTVQYGLQQLVLNASTAGATASLAIGYEDFALKNAVTQAGSIGGN